MLTRLAITNLATIRSLVLNLEDGFTVLTGETGAGKSILIDALRFVLGARASSAAQRDGAATTSVEAVFALEALPQVRNLLEELGIPAEAELVLRRALQPTGRSRSLANDTVVSQGALERLGAELVDIHGQHDNQGLLRAENHLLFLDELAGLAELRGRVGDLHRDYHELLRRRKALAEEREARATRTEALAATVAEIEAAAPERGEDETLAQELRVLAHAEQLIQLTGAVAEALYEREQSIVAELGELAEKMEQAAEIDPSLKALSEQIPALRYQGEDIYQSLRSRTAGLEADPERLDWLNARLAELERLKRKHGGSLEAVLRTRAEAEQALARLQEEAASEAGLEDEVVAMASRLHALSMQLSERRRQAREAFDRQVAGHLRELGMDKVHFETLIEPLNSPSGKAPYYTPHGMDRVEFLLSANPGQAPRPLARIASGGELSRVMLALKTVLADADRTPTLIFDEVDAGISGRVAEMAGRKLRSLAKGHQVLCVTHLPQIAALGHQHVLVRKGVAEGQTETTAQRLNTEEQVQEVARLLSGMTVSPHSLASAEEMVKNAAQVG